MDTDESNFGLYKQLGFEQPKDFMESLGGKKALSEKLMKFIRSEQRERLQILEDFTVKDIPEELVVGEDGGVTRDDMINMAAEACNIKGDEIQCRERAVATKVMTNL